MQLLVEDEQLFDFIEELVNYLSKFSLQLLVEDEQLFDFIEELVNYLEGMIAQVDSVSVRNANFKALFLSDSKALKLNCCFLDLQENPSMDRVTRWYRIDTDVKTLIYKQPNFSLLQIISLQH